MVETVLSTASLIVSAASLMIAKSSLQQAKLAIHEQKQANEQAHMDWAQRKWYDLYFKAEQASTAAEESQDSQLHMRSGIPSVGGNYRLTLRNMSSWMPTPASVYY